jgi:tRNA(fMet)-specific endonuclease VapC
MPYLIDSNWVIPYLDGDAAALQLLEVLAPDGIAISIITDLEIYHGVLRAPDPAQAEAQIQTFLDTVPLLSLTLAVARRCALLREMLRRQGKRIKPRALDLIIAATALEHGLTLVTRNPDDFKDLPGLRLH